MITFQQVGKPIEGRQLGTFAGKSSVWKEATLATSIPLDTCTTEDHGHHLQIEAAYKQVSTLRLGQLPVKGKDSNAMA